MLQEVSPGVAKEGTGSICVLEISWWSVEERLVMAEWKIKGKRLTESLIRIKEVFWTVVIIRK